MIAPERDGNLHAGELARMFGVTPQATHRLLRPLERAD
jgi:DNA-binding IclR family transcriptional regulator